MPGALRSCQRSLPLLLVLCLLGACRGEARRPGDERASSEERASGEGRASGAERAASASEVSTRGRRLHPTHRDYVMDELPRGAVVVHDAFGQRHVLEVEVAATPDARERGMMWRTAMGEETGMLFVFPSVEEQGFWMKNTLIPLDLLFIGPDRRIVGIVAEAQPRSLRSLSVGAPSRWVLEVPGGWAARHGVVAGARVELRGAAARPAEDAR